jgi:hypothetical protein
MPPHAMLCSSICVSASVIQHLCFSLYVSVSVIQHSCFSIYVSASVIQQSCSSIHVPAVVFQHSCSIIRVLAFVFQQSCSSICDSANICVRTCVAASVFAFCVAASVYSFVLQHLCSHLCFSICVPMFVFQHFQRLLCVLHKQSIAINDNLNHLLQSSVMAIFPTEAREVLHNEIYHIMGTSDMKKRKESYNMLSMLFDEMQVNITNTWIIPP